MNAEFGRMGPSLVGPIPGPKSVNLAFKLAQYESSGLSQTASTGAIPVFWAEAAGANVRDVDGNVYVDCTAGYGVAAVGHSNPAVVEAIRQESTRLTDAMSGVFPHPARVALAETLVRVAGRGPNRQVILANSGSEAVELAIKTAALYTGRPGLISFDGGFHGHSLGALSVSSQRAFRDPFRAQIANNTVFVPYPDPYHPPLGARASDVAAACLDYLEDTLRDRASGLPEVGAVIVEPLQGLNGFVVPPDDFLPGLAALCRQQSLLLIADEVFTGFGRTGAWLAVDHARVVPDIVCVGKAMSGGLPIAACLAGTDIMAAWRTPDFVSLHSSTFMGNPLCCAAAQAAIGELERHDLVAQAAAKGERCLAALRDLQRAHGLVGDVRGRGLALAIELVEDRDSKAPAPEQAARLVRLALQRGVCLLLTRFPTGNVVALSPPLVITDEQMSIALAILDDLLGQMAQGH